MAKLIPNDSLILEDKKVIVSQTGIAKIYNTGSLSWWNATKSIKVVNPPFGAIICPPNGKTFYESTDPNGEICLRKFQQLPPTPITTNSESLSENLQRTRESEGSFLTDPIPTIDYVPFSENENTKIAIQVTDMYDFTSDAIFNIVYEVGITPQTQPFIYTIRNKCIDNSIRVSLNKPEYIILDVENIFDIPAGHSALISISIDESPIKELSKQKTKLFSTPIELKVYPLDVMGVVLVRTDLLPLTTYSIESQVTQSVLPIPPEEFENIKTSIIGTNKWFNNTKNVIVDLLPEDAIICPPGQNSFYEITDNNGLICLRNNNLLPNSYCSRGISLSGSLNPIEELTRIVFVSSSNTQDIITSASPVEESSFDFLDSMQGTDLTILTSHTSDTPLASWASSSILGSASLQLDTRNSQQGLYVKFSGSYFQPTVYNSNANITFAAGKDVQFTTYVFGSGAGSLGSYQPAWGIRFCRSVDENNYLVFSSQLEAIGATTSSIFLSFDNSIGDIGISYASSVTVPIGLVTFGATLGNNLNTVDLWYIHESNPTTKVSITTLTANILNSLSGLLNNTGLSIDYPGSYGSIPTTELQFPLKQIKVYTP